MSLTLPTLGQIYGDKDTEQLEVFKKLGVGCKITDFAVYHGKDECSFFPSRDYKKLEPVEFFKYYYTKSDYPEWPGYIAVINSLSTNFSMENVQGVGHSHGFTIRPIVSVKEINSCLIHEVGKKNGILELEYGNYPRSYENDSNIQKRLKIEAFKDLEYKVCTTNMPYSYADGRKSEIHIKEFEIIPLDNQKYVKLELTYSNLGVWAKIEPIRWYYDKKSELLIAKEGIISNIPFIAADKDVSFEDSQIKWFLDNILSKEIIDIDDSLKITIEQQTSKSDFIKQELKQVDKDRDKIYQLRKSITK